MKLLACGFWLALAALHLGSCQFPSYEIRTEADGAGENAGGSPPGGTGGTPTAGNGGEGGNGGNVSPPLCGEEESCQPETPNGWLGPVAFYIDDSDKEVPDCPEGYGDPIDLHADPVGEPLTCECACTPIEQKCETPGRVRIYGNLNCGDPCADAGATECTNVTGCSGNDLSIGAPVMPPIGKCRADVTSTYGERGWARSARLCEADGGSEECGAAQSCFPTPPDPFASQLCVYRVVLEGQAAPTCPEAYPSGPHLLYSTFEDERKCGPCTCQGLTGGKCEGQVTINAAECGQATSLATYKIGDACLKIQDVKTVVTRYMMTPGTCGVAEEPVTVGEIVPTGRFHAVCCSL
jgi:hypothetical protein